MKHTIILLLFSCALWGQNKTKVVSDTVRKIIDELNLCEYSDFLKNAPYYNCYDVSEIYNIKSKDNSYANFIFQAPGGSAGGAIVVFCKRNGKYKKIEMEEGGIIQKLLPQTTNGFYDIVIWHRAHKVDGEDVLYKWNGNKYVKDKVYLR